MHEERMCIICTQQYLFIIQKSWQYLPIMRQRLYEVKDLYKQEVF